MRWSDTEAIGLFEEIKNGRNVTDNYGRLIWNYTNRGNSWRDREMVGLLEKIRNGTDVADNYGRAYWNYQRRGNGWAERTISSVLSQLQTASAVPPAPTNSVIPVVTGNNWEGQTLSTTNGTWTNSPTSYTYQWTADGTNIGGATSSTYVLATGQAEKVVRCVVTAHNAGGTGNATSDPTPTVIGNPLTVFGANLVAWYDPSDSSSITQSSGLVSQFNDKSGNANHLTASSTARPTYSATAVLGKPGLVYDGAANVMATSNTAIGTGNKMACFIVAEVDNAMSPSHRLVSYVANGDGGDFSANSVTLLAADDGAGTDIHAYQGGNKASWGTVPIYGPQPPVAKQLNRLWSVSDHVNSTIYCDNVASTAVASTNGLNTPGSFIVGSRANGSQPWKGAIGEIILLNRDPTAPERDKMQRWSVRNWTRVLVAEGDSLVHGAVAGSPAFEDGYVRRFAFNSNPSCFVDNISIGGSDLDSNNNTSDIVYRALNNAYASVRIPGSKDGKKYVFYSAVTNNIGGSQGTAVYHANTLGAYLQARKAEGYDYVGTSTILSRTDAGQGTQPAQNTMRNAINAILVSPAWKATYGIDFVADLSSDPIMGVDSAPDVNPTYFQADKVHPTSIGHARLEPIFTAAVNAV